MFLIISGSCVCEEDVDVAEEVAADAAAAASSAGGLSAGSSANNGSRRIVQLLVRLPGQLRRSIYEITY